MKSVKGLWGAKGTENPWLAKMLNIIPFSQAFYPSKLRLLIPENTLLVLLVQHFSILIPMYTPKKVPVNIFVF